MSPPRDKGAAVELRPDDCRYLAPEREMPSVAASLAPGPDAARTPRVTVTTSEVPGDGGGCVTTLKSTLEAHDAAGARSWSLPLADRRSAHRCPPPP